MNVSGYQSNNWKVYLDKRKQFWSRYTQNGGSNFTDAIVNAFTHAFSKFSKSYKNLHQNLVTIY